MSGLRSVIKFEFIRYFLSPLAYVYLISFLFLSGSCAIYFGHFFVDGQANLWGLFDYQPWIYLLFIPAIAMRSWAEEFRSKSIIQLISSPVKIEYLVWGKYFASLLFAVIAIMLTFPFWITVNIYGDPDNTVILVNYLGCFLLAGAMLAISQTMSALTKNPVIALVLSVFVNLLFFWSGFEYVLFWAREIFNDVIVDTIVSFSFLTHFFSLSRGLVELRDLIFFLSLIIFFNLLTISIISLKTKGSAGLIASSNVKYCAFVWCLLFVGFLGLNIIANNVFRLISYDFTEEKYLSLTKNTKDILRKLNRPVTARLYYSPVLGKRNPTMRLYFDQVKLLLKQYKTYGHGNFDFKIYTPNFLDKTEDRALADGLQPIPLIDVNQNALFGIVFSDNLTNKSVIPFFPVERMSYLEQDFTTAIYKLHHQKKTVGVLSTLPVMGNVWQSSVLINRWEIMNKIAEIYNIKVIEKPEDFSDIDVLMLIHPHHLSSDMIDKIKEQEKVLLLLDVADDASRIYSPEHRAFISSNLGELEKYWHIRFYDYAVAADFNNSITVDDTVNYKKNPSFTQDLLQFKATPKEFYPNHRITYKLHNLLFSSASMIMPTDTQGIYFFPLIKTSDKSALMLASFAQENKTPKEVLDAFSPQNDAIIVAAQILSNNPLIPFDIIAVADTDFIYDSFWSREKRFLDTTYHVPLFDSANFILNSLDYLTKNDDLIALRGKGVKPRPLYIIDNIRKENTYRYKLQENEIFNALDIVHQQLAEITAKRSFEERENFNADELAVIGKIRQEMADLRQKLSDIRLSANKNIDSIEVKVKFYDIYFIALLILACSLLFYFRNRKIKILFSRNLLVLDAKTTKLILSVILISLIAVATVYLDNKNNISSYEDKLVFKDFSKKINDIYKIKLENSQQTLTFVKSNGVWKLEEFPDFPVYQERLRRLLINITNMTFFEKKSNRAEDMKYFGFSPLQNKNSPMLQLSFIDKNDKELEALDIGWSDIDIGRGSKASFIRLKNQFQIWLAEVDFFDLSLKKQEWTYDTLWNLRFGRLFSFNDVSDNLKVMQFVKNLLNTHILKITDNIDAQKIGEINISAEHENLVKLIFYRTDENEIFVSYQFGETVSGHHLEFFKDYMKDKYLEISKEDWEVIKDDIKPASK